MLEAAHEQYRVQHSGQPAASDREALLAVSSLLDQASASEVRPGWEGGGGVRVFPPRPRPPPPKASDMPVDVNGDRPLQMGVLPLLLLDAVSNGARTAVHQSSIGMNRHEPLRQKPVASQETATLLEPHLEQLLRRLDGVLDHPDGLLVDGSKRSGTPPVLLPPPVLEACNAVFISKHGRPPTDSREAMHLVCDVLPARVAGGGFPSLRPRHAHPLYPHPRALARASFPLATFARALPYTCSVRVPRPPHSPFPHPYVHISRCSSTPTPFTFTGARAA